MAVVSGINMPNLVLYSGGQNRSNYAIHKELVGIAKEIAFWDRLPVTMTYIPSCSEGAEVYYNRAKKRYSRFGVSNFICLPPETKPNTDQALEALHE